MDFDLNTEQSLLKESVARLFAADKGAAHRRSKQVTADSAAGLWAKFAENGLLAIGFDEALGGMGPAPFEAMVIGQEIGRAYCASPFLESVVMPGEAFRLTENTSLAQRIAPAVMQGDARLACIFEGLVAERDGEGWRVRGEAVCAPYGDEATGFIAAAQTGAGWLVFYMTGDAPQATRRAYKTFDISPAARVSIDNLPVRKDDVLAAGADGAAMIEAMQCAGVAFLAAEAVGLMEMMFEATIEHLRTRVQFGQKLANFQALQHRVAEMAVALEQARSAAIARPPILTPKTALNVQRCSGG
ncbi:MAG: acyl-CoA dehydrogenase family protein [Parvularculaceae bacterium]